jgi:hypothetical protein
MCAVIDRFLQTETINKPNIRTCFSTELILLIPGFDFSDVISEDRFELKSIFLIFLTVTT